MLAQPEDAGVVRVDEDTGLGVALATDGNGRFARLDPYAGAQLALAEAYRNVAVAGARPLAVSDCLNFGSPEDPGVMWQFAEACRGLADGCRELGLPVTGGNVSFYNQTGDVAILPTPVVGVLGVLEDVTRRTPIGFADEGDVIYLLGRTRDELGGSEWAHEVHAHLGGRPPVVDLDAERALADVLGRGSVEGLLRVGARPRRRRSGAGDRGVVPAARGRRPGVARRAARAGRRRCVRRAVRGVAARAVVTVSATTSTGSPRCARSWRSSSCGSVWSKPPVTTPS